MKFHEIFEISENTLGQVPQGGVVPGLFHERALDRLRTVGYAAQAVTPAGFALLPWVGMASAAEKETGLVRRSPEQKKSGG